MEHFKEHFEEQFREVTVYFRVGVTSFGDEFLTESYFGDEIWIK